MRHNIYKKTEERHAVSVSADDLLKMLKAARIVPLTVVRFDEVDMNEAGDVEVRWTTIGHSETEEPTP